MLRGQETWVACSTSANLQQNLSGYVSGLDATMRRSGIGERECRRDRHLEMPRLDRLVELLQLDFLITKQGVVPRDGDTRPRLRHRLDAGGIRDASAGTQRIETLVQRIATTTSGAPLVAARWTSAS